MSNSDRTVRVMPAPIEDNVISFTPVEPGWVRAEVDEQRTLDSGQPVLYISPVIGYAILRVVQDELTFNTLIPVGPNVDPEYYDNEPMPNLYYSRTMFRRAQAGELILSQSAFLKGVSE